MGFKFPDALIAAYGRDLEACEAGRPMYGKNGLVLGVRHIDSALAKAAKKVNAKRSAPYPGAVVTDEIIDANMNELAIAVVASWSARDEQGTPIPCIDETKRFLFSDPSFSELRDAVIAFSVDSDNFRPLPTVAA